MVASCPRAVAGPERGLVPGSMAHVGRQPTERTLYSEPTMGLGYDFREVASRVGYAVLLFVGSLIVFAVFIGSNVLLDWFLGFAVDKGTAPYQWTKSVLDAALVGCGLLVTLGGVVIVAMETWASVWSFVSRTRSNN